MPKGQASYDDAERCCQCERVLFDRSQEDGDWFYCESARNPETGVSCAHACCEMHGSEQDAEDMICLCCAGSEN